jgi:hypothetical protein
LAARKSGFRDAVIEWGYGEQLTLGANLVPVASSLLLSFIQRRKRVRRPCEIIVINPRV